MTSALHQQVRRTIRRNELLAPDSRVLVGVSGGSDSVALTLLLRDLARHGEFALVGLAHLNHGLRPAAAADEAFCQQFAESLHLPIVVEREDVRQWAESGSYSLEDAARRLRYSFLDRAARSLNADRIAVGHTQDDQAETVLLKLMRGAGLTGLGGIYPRRGAVIRPLLDIPRADLRTFLQARRQSWIEDESNADVENPRNRIRHRVLPELDRAAGACVRPAVTRAAALIREDAGWLADLSRQRFEAIARETEDGLTIEAAALVHEPRPIRRRVLLEAMRRMSGGREICLEHVEAAMALVSGSDGGVDVPGGRLERRRGTLRFTRQRAPVR